MLILSTFRATFRNSIVPRHCFVPFHFQTQKHFHCFRFQINQSPPPMPPKVFAGYAKSNRSLCKKCSNIIAAKALRLGSVTRDSRGFDMTKWHHVDCFPIVSESVDSAESIQGFSFLQRADQEALKKLVAKCRESKEEVSDESKEGSRKRKSKGLMVQKTDKDEEEVELDETNPKKGKYAFNNKFLKLYRPKLSTPADEANLEIAFSVSDIKDKYKDAILFPNWKAFLTIIFLERDDGLQDSKKIAAFDFDGCLVKTNVKRVGADAWSLMYPSVPDKLQSLYKDGYKLVIFTNEANIERWKNKRQIAVHSKLGRLNNFIKRVKVPIQVFVACGSGSGKAEDPFRKPKPGMWQIMEKYFNSGILIDMDQSFYVGDAAGRENDHSDADIKFAQVVGLKFYVPEEFFGP